MLTIFTTPKPFCGHIDVIQRNALESWKRLHVGGADFQKQESHRGTETQREDWGPKQLARLKPAATGERDNENLAGLKPATTGAPIDGRGAEIEVIVFGDEEGTAEVCREMGLRHEPAVERSASGTKYVRSIFGRAQEIARHDVVAYVNCDIVLTDDFARAVARVAAAFGARPGIHEIRNSKIENRKEQNINTEDTERQRAQRESGGEILRSAQDDDVPKDNAEAQSTQRERRENQFLMVGRRWDTNIAAAIDFSASDWAERARAMALETNQQRGSDWIDYFVFRRGMYREIPPLVIGRVGWDNWLVWKARSEGLPVVDATEAVVAIHQNHDYGYHPQGKQGVWQDEEARRNYELAGGVRHIYTMDDATHRLTREGIEANPGYRLAPVRRALRRGRAAVWHAILGATRPVRHALGLRKSG